eukprot:TRINITY_DN2506_c0_g1_i1.p1 TRINITY_DN2506_c0_g1~~TRINITY_DN2506_c0_g1_i1.p1  ORF type:complete len:139 (+),score=13.54 TRINITY_DN2506_c0_g1_i1:66-482(+)
MESRSWTRSIYYFVLIVLFVAVSSIQWGISLTRLDGITMEHGRNDLSLDDMRIHERKSRECVQRLLCEIYSSGSKELSESEALLINKMNQEEELFSSSRLHFAAFIGDLNQGIEGGECAYFFPDCPISKSDIRKISHL